MTDEDKTVTVSLAIIGIVILEVLAIVQGIDGTYLSLAIAAIAGLGGFVFRDIISISQTIKEKAVKKR